MKRIEDERIRFYLQHRQQIEEWSAVEPDVHEFAHQFYLGLADELHAAVRDVCRDGSDPVMSFKSTKNWPGISFRRAAWPSGIENPHVRLEWARVPPRRALFSRDDLVCGVRAKRFRDGFRYERCREAYPKQEAWWVACRLTGYPGRNIWENDNLEVYGREIVDTVRGAWIDLAPFVDEALQWGGGKSP